MYLVGSPLFRTRRLKPSLRWDHDTTPRKLKSGQIDCQKEEGLAMSKSYRRLLVPLVAILGIATCGLLGAGAGTASAGLNGQKINYESHQAINRCTAGENEHGELISNSCADLRRGPNVDKDRWWVGQVTIIWRYRDGKDMRTTCSVPKSQEADYVTCDDPS